MSIVTSNHPPDGPAHYVQPRPTDAFRAWLDQAIAEAPRTEGGIPLLGAETLDLKDAAAVSLIVALADIIERACISAVPTTHVVAA
jgi:hypothetical protein